MTFEQLSAFTVCDDHERQVQVWEQVRGSWNKDARAIKDALVCDEVRSSDKRVRFIGGLAAYEQAGGAVRRDLFDNEGGGFALDVVLLDRLVTEKLETVAAPFREQGWQFVETVFDRPDWVFGRPRVHPETVELSAGEQAERDALCDEHDELADLINNAAADEAAAPRIEAIDKRLDELDGKQQVYRDEDKAQSGVVVTLGYHGDSDILIGVRKPETARENEADREGGGEDAATVTVKSEETPKLTHSAVLIEDLTAQKTAAIRAELADNHDVALAAVVHALLLRVAYGHAAGGYSGLELSLSSHALHTSMKQPQDNIALAQMETLKERFDDQLPGNPADLWEWCLDQTREQLLALLAYAAAQSVNAVEGKFFGRKDALAHAGQLGKALDVKMADYFEPTAESYFNHLNRSSIQAAVSQVRGADFAAGISSMKKAAAAVYAEQSVKGSGWLPAPVRLSGMETTEGETVEVDQFPLAAE